MTAKILPAVAVLAALGAASVASANTLVTFTGTLTDGTDYTGVFGTPGASQGCSTLSTESVLQQVLTK
jgi:hypothetical protein